MDQNLDITIFERIPFTVEGIRVDPDNLNEVAAWCGGEVRQYLNKKKEVVFYIKVEVSRPLNPKQTQAHFGDWVLKTETGFKVYTDVALHKSFRSTDPMQSPGEKTAPVTLTVSVDVENAAVILSDN